MIDNDGDAVENLTYQFGFATRPENNTSLQNT